MADAVPLGLAAVVRGPYRGLGVEGLRQYFADYSGYVAKQLGDRVAGFITINEFACFLNNGYSTGQTRRTSHRGRRDCRKVLNQARHHAVYGHGLSAKRSVPPAGAKARRSASPRTSPTSSRCWKPSRTSPPHGSAARHVGHVPHTDHGRALSPQLPQGTGPDAPKFTDEQMKTITTPLDFVGRSLRRARGLATSNREAAR